LEAGEPVLPTPHPFRVEGLEEQFFVHDGKVSVAVPAVFTKSVGDQALHVEARFQACGTVDEESVPSARLVTEARVMPEKEPGRGEPIGPLDWLEVLPLKPVASSDRLGGVGLEAARYRASPAFELNQPALTHHMLVLFARPPEELDVRYEGVKRHVPPPGQPHFRPPKLLAGG
jgi:hypothetical protein